MLLGKVPKRGLGLPPVLSATVDLSFWLEARLRDQRELETCGHLSDRRMTLPGLNMKLLRLLARCNNLELITFALSLLQCTSYTPTRPFLFLEYLFAHAYNFAALRALRIDSDHPHSLISKGLTLSDPRPT